MVNHSIPVRRQMADVLRIAASVIAVVQLAGECFKMSKQWLGPSEFGSAHLAEIQTTLLGFSDAASKFHANLEAYENNARKIESLGFLSRVLERCKGALDVVKDFVENLGFIGKHIIGLSKTTLPRV